MLSVVRWRKSALLANCAALVVIATPAGAQDATWAGPGTDWNNGAYWTGNGGSVPTGTAIFTGATPTIIGLTADTSIGTIQFDAGAPAHILTVPGPSATPRVLNLTGQGIVNNSSFAPQFIVDGAIHFRNSSTAANARFGIHTGIGFWDSSSAGSASITLTSPDIFSTASVSFNNDSTAGNAVITNTLNAGVHFRNSSTAGNAQITSNGSNLTASFAGTSDAGHATFTRNTGTMTIDFTQSSSADHVTINGGTARFFHTSTAANASLNNGAVAELYFTATLGNATLTNSGAIFFDTTSAGNAVINTDRGVWFAGISTAANATITGNATSNLLFDVGSNAGNATITSNGGLIEFTGSNTAANATITTNSNAYLRFAGESTAGNARIINNASLVDFSRSFGPNRDQRLSVGSIEGSGRFLLGSGQVLTAGSNNRSTNVTGTIAEDNLGHAFGATLKKVGSGTLTLSGMNSYTGATVIEAGGLVVNGSIASSSGLTVNNGAFIGGSGQLPTTTFNGGTLAPGNSIGTITVNGNLTLTSATTYMVEVSPTAADRTSVTGTASLAGTVNAVFQPGSYLTRSYTIVSAASRTGTFGTVTTTNLPAGFNANVSYTSTEAVLNLTAVLNAPASGGGGSSPAAIQTSLNSSFNAGAALPAAFIGVYGLTGTDLSNALTQLSGEVATGAATAAFQTGDRFLALMLDPYLENRVGDAPAHQGAMNAYASLPRKAGSDRTVSDFDRRWTVWGAPFGARGRIGGDAANGTHTVSASNAGLAAGADYRLSPDSRVGFALAGSAVNWGLGTLGSGRGEAIQGGAYAVTRSGNAYLSAAASLGWYDLSTDRTVVAPGVIDRLSAHYQTYSFGGRAEAGYRVALGNAGLTPYLAGQAQSFRTPGYRERDVFGLEAFALNYAGQSTGASRSELGARFDSRFTLGQDTVLILRTRGAWAHEFSPNRSLTADFQAIPGAAFAVRGASAAADNALVSVGSELRFRNGVSLSATFDAELARRTHLYAGTGTLRYSW